MTIVAKTSRAALMLLLSGCNGHFFEYTTTSGAYSSSGMYTGTSVYSAPATAATTTPVAASSPTFETVCPIGAVARVTPSHVIVQATRLNGEPWDGLPLAVRRLGCPSILVNPGAELRGLLGINTGTVGDAALDAAATVAMDQYLLGVVSACRQLRQGTDILDSILGAFDRPDVELQYQGGGRRFHSETFQNARPTDLQRLDRRLAPMEVPCAQADAPLLVHAIDHDMFFATEDIGTVRTTLRELGVEAFCAGFSYVTPAQPNRIVTVGLRVQGPGGCP